MNVDDGEKNASFSSVGSLQQRCALASSILCICAAASGCLACALPHWGEGDARSLGLWALCLRLPDGTQECMGMDAEYLPCQGFVHAARVLSIVGIVSSFLGYAVAAVMALASVKTARAFRVLWAVVLALAFIASLLCVVFWILLPTQVGCPEHPFGYCLWLQLAAALLSAAAVGCLAALGRPAPQVPKAVSSLYDIPRNPSATAPIPVTPIQVPATSPAPPPVVPSFGPRPSSPHPHYRPMPYSTASFATSEEPAVLTRQSFRPSLGPRPSSPHPHYRPLQFSTMDFAVIEQVMMQRRGASNVLPSSHYQAAELFPS